MRRILFAGGAAAWVLGWLLASTDAQSQELAPRAYWPAPVGTNVASLTYQYTTGDVVMDPSLPVTGVDSRIHAVQAAYQRTFGLLGRTSSLQIALPYSWATTEGFYLGEPASRSSTAPSTPGCGGQSTCSVHPPWTCRDSVHWPRTR